MKIQTLEDARAAFDANPKDPEAIHDYFTRIAAAVTLGLASESELRAEVARLGDAMAALLPPAVVANATTLCKALPNVPPEALARLVMELREEGREVESAEMIEADGEEGFAAAAIRLKPLPGEDDGIGTPQGTA